MNFFKRCIRWAIYMLLGIGIPLYGSLPVAALTRIEAIYLMDGPNHIQVRMTSKPQWKTIQFDPREILFAFQDTQLSPQLDRKGMPAEFISGIGIEVPSGDVVSMLVSTKKNIDEIKAVWDDASNSILVQLNVKNPTPPKAVQTPSVQKKSVKGGPKTKPNPAQAKAEIPKGPFRGRRPNGATGGLDDIVLEVKDDPCFAKQDLKEALLFIRRKTFPDAVGVLDAYLATDPPSTDKCLEPVRYLKAYAYFKMYADTLNRKKYVEAFQMFQDATLAFPHSKLLPFAFAAMAKLEDMLNNRIMGEGYYTILLRDFPEYPGISEVLYEMGRLLNQRKRIEEAAALYQKVISDHPYSLYINGAMVELGKIMYQQNRFIDALQLLSKVLETEPQKAYESPELLLFIGKAYHQLGKTTEARKILTRVYNLFPDFEANHIVLTRIGDSYADEKQKEKAIKIYRLVTEKYPETEGFVISTMRLADLLDDPEEKESLYKMVIAEYKDNPISRLAMMRLATLYNDIGEYDKSIKMLETLLSKNPRALKNEALNLMEDSFESLFKKLLEADEYPVILNRFKQDEKVLNSFESPRIMRIIGQAYLRGHLYEKALEAFDLADTHFAPAEKPIGLAHEMATAFYATEQWDEALKKFGQYLRKGKDEGLNRIAHERMGQIFMAREHYHKAIEHYKTLFQTSQTDGEKSRMLVLQAEGFRRLAENKTAARLLHRALNFLIKDPESHGDSIFRVYKSLGETYYTLASYVKAVDNFDLALKYVKKDQSKPDVVFMLGESYHKGKILDKAKKTYQELVDMEDPFWSKMAQERLDWMDLEAKLNRT